MFGFLKKFFSKPGDSPPTQPPPAPLTIPAGPARMAAPAATYASSPPVGGDNVLLPLNDILARLPDPLTRLVLSRPGGSFSLPAGEIVDQLRSGAVRIPFGQLRQGSPPGAFSNDVSQDGSMIDLPLPLVLAALGPARLARRTNQKRLDVPEEIGGVFGPKSSAPVQPAGSQPAATAAPPLSAPPKPALPKPGPLKPVTSIAGTSSAPKPPPSAPLPFVAPKPASPMPFVTTRPATVAPSAPPVAAEEAVVTTLGILCESWPEVIRQEIETTGSQSASVAIPLNRLETAMKTGRVAFTWGEMTDWLTNPPAGASAHRAIPVELPLKVITPLFMAKHRSIAQKKVTLGENIPNLFAGLVKPAALPTAAEAKAPAGVPKIFAAGSGEEPRTDDVFGRVFGQPSKKDWSLQDIAQGINSLPGVAYGLLATPDGLLVAGQAPAPLDANTLAAFLPQIFGRAAHYTEEACLGSLETLTLSVGRAPHLIFKAGPLYMAVVGRPGEALPEEALQNIAGQIARRNQ